MAPPRIVVLGAGFGGLAFCQRFSGRASITVVDRQNHHLFQPLLYQVATAGLSAPDIAQPIRSILSDTPDLRVLMAEVEGFDLAGRKVRLSTGDLEYDWLVVALGSVTSYFGNDDWARHAPGLKSLDDALEMRRRVLSAFERAENEENADRRRELMTMVVIGGGPTGVELAGAFAELARTVLRKDFDRIDPARARVILIEGSERLLGTFPAGLAEKAREQLIELGVEVRTGVRVERIGPEEVTLVGESIRSGTIIWAAGVGANPLSKLLGAPLDRAGRIKVNADLSLPGDSRVFVIGDLASLTDANGRVVPGLSPAAMQMGRFVADIVARELAGGLAVTPRPAFAYRDKGSMATIGRSRAVAVMGRLQFAGFPAWLAWLVVHLVFLVGFRNRIAVLSHWIYSYFTYKRGARLITGVERGG